MKRRFATGLAKYAFNPIVRTLFRFGVPFRARPFSRRSVAGRASRDGRR